MCHRWLRLGSLRKPRDLIPRCKSPSSKCPIMARWQQMPAKAKEIVDGALNRQKPLGLSWGFEPAHLVFPLTCWLMRDFRSIVLVAILAVAHAGQELAAGRAITPQMIGHKQTGNVVQTF